MTRDQSVTPRVAPSIRPIDPSASVLPYRTPRIWLLIGDKLGDNQQVELIAERITQRLGWPVEVRRLRFREGFQVGGSPKFRVDHSHVDWSKSDATIPPWPDLVLTIGRRPSMVALWIKELSQDTAKIVIVGRPRRWLHRFDLIIAAAHHHVPPMPNVVRLGLPLITVDALELAEARSVWPSRFASMRRPLFALLVGGGGKPYVFDRGVAHDLMAKTMRCVAAAGGSLWVTTSPRTPAEVVDALEESLPAGVQLFRWRPNDPDNPYLGLLACADRFIATGDSVSMQVAVARLGKPLAIYRLPAEYDLAERLRRAAAHVAYGKSSLPVLRGFIRGMQRLGIVQFPRDVDEVHALLFERGLAVTLGEPFGSPGSGVDVDLDDIVDRIGAMLIDANGQPRDTWEKASAEFG